MGPPTLSRIRSPNRRSGPWAEAASATMNIETTNDTLNHRENLKAVEFFVCDVRPRTGIGSDAIGSDMIDHSLAAAVKFAVDGLELVFR
jgi:hypothetical protein